MINISQESVIQEIPNKKRGRPHKSLNMDTKTVVGQTDLVDNNIVSQISSPEQKLYNFQRMFKKIEGLNRVVDRRIVDYTQSELEMYIAEPVRYMSELIEINNYMYNTNGFFREFIEYLVRPILYRWVVNSEIKNVNFYEPKDTNKFHTKVKKDFFNFVNRINSLDLGKELNKILLKICLEDAVFGYWLEDGDVPTIYYLPAQWCKIRSTMNGMYTFSIDSRKPSSKDLKQVLPREIARLIEKHKGKAGEGVYAPVPYEKCVCYKYNDIYSFLFPPFTYVILAIMRLMKMIDIADAKDELDTLNLLAMEIPINDKEHDDLILTADVVEPVVETTRRVVSDLVGVIPTPMKVSSIPLSKNQNIEKNSVKNAIDSYGEWVNMPSFGAANSGAELKKSIENASSKLFTVLDQISNGINLKMKLEGYTYSLYDFRYEILHINEFNKVEIQEILLKQCQAGLFAKQRLGGALGYTPLECMGQSYMENIIFRDVIDNATVFPTAYTQVNQGAGNSGGRKPLPEDLAQPSTIKGRETQQNSPENRDSQ